MTSKLICPFCGETLRKYGEIDPDTGTSIVLGANCPKCSIGDSDIKLWQALIQAKQDLAKAIDVIDTVRQHKRGTAVICPNDIAVYCDRALEQIEHKG